jgi:putative transposase
MLKLITETTDATDEATAVTATLDDLARAGAQRMIAAALQIEVADYVARFREERDAAGHARVVRNGTARARPLRGTVRATNCVRMN